MKKQIFIIFFSLFVNQIFAQNLTYRDYLSLVLKTNYELEAQKQNISISEADIILEGLMPDPMFEFGNAAADITGQDLPSQWYIGFTQTIETGKKRKKRVELALVNKSMEMMAFESLMFDYKYQFTIKYIAALHKQLAAQKLQNLKYQLDRESYLIQKDSGLVDENKVKEKSEKINEQIDELDNELRLTYLDLGLPLIYYQQYDKIHLIGNLRSAYRFEPLDTLIKRAKKNKKALLLARIEVEKSGKEIALTEAKRKQDIDIMLAYNYFPIVTNLEAPTPAFSALTATVAFPIPFSNLKKADLEKASLLKIQAENEMFQVEYLIEIQVRKSYLEYQRLEKKVKQLLEEGFDQNEDYLEYLDLIKEYNIVIVNLKYAIGDLNINF